jgi:glycosyltransferase involved in cell wall biosynthesis
MEKRVGECDLFVDMVPHLSLGATYFRLPDLTYWNLLPLNETSMRSYTRLGDLYLWPARRLMRRFLTRQHPVKMHVANSQYTRNAIIERVGSRLEPIVIYPPVDVSLWSFNPDDEVQRGDIASFARFDSWKRHDLQLRLVRGLDAHLKIIGRAVTDPETAHLQRLKEAVRGDRHIEFLVNLPQNEVKRLLCSSKVFIHTADAEPFGITIVEAIAAGCVPIVRDEGGAREIVPFDELRFETIEEGQEKIRRALNGEYDHLLSRLKEHVRRFDQETFRKEMTKTVLRLWENDYANYSRRTPTSFKRIGSLRT